MTGCRGVGMINGMSENNSGGGRRLTRPKDGRVVAGVCAWMREMPARPSSSDIWQQCVSRMRRIVMLRFSECVCHAVCNRLAR